MATSNCGYLRAPLGERLAMLIGIPREVHPGERRVAATPESILKLRELGFEVAGAARRGLRLRHHRRGLRPGGRHARRVRRRPVEHGDVVVKVRPPTPDEATKARPGTTLISLLQPERDEELPAVLRRASCRPSPSSGSPASRAPRRWTCSSSMANIAGYRAVDRGGAALPAVLRPRRSPRRARRPPARVLVIGAGVAGLAAIGAARALGAEVRAFDTRAAAREQVESLGAEFLERRDRRRAARAAAATRRR